jgi:hypothetical protein
MAIRMWSRWNMGIPILLFLILLYVAGDELGLRGILLCLTISATLLFGCAVLALSPYFFITLQAFMDIILILVIFGHDIRIR